MQQGNWQEIKEKLRIEDKKIFKNINKEKLNEYEKRNIIFDYLCNNIIYDYDLMADIFLSSFNFKNNNTTEEAQEILASFIIANKITDSDLVNSLSEKIKNKNYKQGRNLVQELMNVIDEHKGICNSISQYYKLLLDYNDIYSVCVICDNMLPRKHQINLVYDKSNNTYSFDDITTAITNPNLKEKCFDYDLESAKELNQGLRTVGYPDYNERLFDTFGVILSTEVINYYVGRNDNSFIKYETETNNNITLPKNIISTKKRGIIK